MRRWALSVAVLTALCGSVEARPRGGTPIPPAALLNGYTVHTYHAGPFTTSNVDTNQTYNAGYSLYFDNYFGTIPAKTSATINADGTLLLNAPLENGVLGSLGKISAATPYHGTGFGCGAYITGELSFPGAFNPASQSVTLFLMALEHLVYPQGASQQAWVGQPSPYDHFIEVDTLEFNTLQTFGDNYSATLHDWYGDYNVTCGAGNGYCGIDNLETQPTNVFANPGNRATVANNTDFTLFHRYATLWIPATVSTNGTLAFYFDDVLINSFSYSQFTSQGPPPGTPPSQSVSWTWGVIDNQHLGIIIGGTKYNPLTIRSIDVWQNASACNLTN